mmetsp:Transcript_12117/g.29392  ORF Transcript_12117/g.29392 Transcript_12117/m.29392 type:complete len:225 (+) Transcript_12117:715-1389(+)
MLSGLHLEIQIAEQLPGAVRREEPQTLHAQRRAAQLRARDFPHVAHAPHDNILPTRRLGPRVCLGSSMHRLAPRVRRRRVSKGEEARLRPRRLVEGRVEREGDELLDRPVEHHPEGGGVRGRDPRDRDRLLERIQPGGLLPGSTESSRVPPTLLLDEAFLALGGDLHSVHEVPQTADAGAEGRDVLELVDDDGEVVEDVVERPVALGHDAELDLALEVERRHHD